MRRRTAVSIEGGSEWYLFALTCLLFSFPFGIELYGATDLDFECAGSRPSAEYSVSPGFRRRRMYKNDEATPNAL